jgi:hypothetical protein
MPPSSSLPLEARRAAWDRLWRILLAPPAAQAPAGDIDPGAGSREHCPSKQTDTRSDL